MRTNAARHWVDIEPPRFPYQFIQRDAAICDPRVVGIATVDTLSGAAVQMNARRHVVCADILEHVWLVVMYASQL